MARLLAQTGPDGPGWTPDGPRMDQKMVCNYDRDECSGRVSVRLVWGNTRTAWNSGRMEPDGAGWSKSYE